MTWFLTAAAAVCVARIASIAGADFSKNNVPLPAAGGAELFDNSSPAPARAALVKRHFAAAAPGDATLLHAEVAEVEAGAASVRRARQAATAREAPDAEALKLASGAEHLEAASNDASQEKRPAARRRGEAEHRLALALDSLAKARRWTEAADADGAAVAAGVLSRPPAPEAEIADRQRKQKMAEAAAEMPQTENSDARPRGG